MFQFYPNIHSIFSNEIDVQLHHRSFELLDIYFSYQKKYLPKKNLLDKLDMEKYMDFHLLQKKHNLLLFVSILLFLLA